MHSSSWPSRPLCPLCPLYPLCPLCYPCPPCPLFIQLQAYRSDPAVVVLAKLGHRDLHTGSQAHVKSLCEWKPAQDNSGRQEDLLLSVQRAARPERGILLEHGPDDSPDPIIYRRVENDRPAEEICAGSGQARTNRALDIQPADSLGSCKRREEHRMTEAVWRRTCGN